MDQHSESYRKIRNTFRYLLGNINDKYEDVNLDKIDVSELCIVSKTQINFDEVSDIVVETKKALGDKCPVCWKISVEPCDRHPQ